jgi:tetratricopeptide (TPR) repeat protein
MVVPMARSLNAERSSPALLPAINAEPDKDKEKPHETARIRAISPEAMPSPWPLRAAVAVAAFATVGMLLAIWRPWAGSTPEVAPAVAHPAAPEKPAEPTPVADKPASEAKPAADAAAPGEVEAAAKEPAPENAEAAEAKKSLRRKMFDALKKKRWSDAAQAGFELRDSYELDWEAALALAECLQKSKRLDESAEAYRAFIDAFPDNKAVNDARYQLAGILITRKHYDEAKTVLKTVIAGSSGKLKTLSERALKEIANR